MSGESLELIKLVAAGVVGYVFQWVLFAPKKVPQWAAWGVLAVVAVLVYWWATPSFLPGFAANWRLAIYEVIAFCLMAKGTGSAAKSAKIAPGSNSL